MTCKRKRYTEEGTKEMKEPTDLHIIEKYPRGIS
jgi:hypothetical protein